MGQVILSGCSPFLTKPSDGLPIGITALKCIQSTGTQCIDTEFMPNANTRVVMDAQITAQTEPAVAYFGVRSDASGANDPTAYIIWSMSTGANISSDFFGNRVSLSIRTIGTRVKIDKNKKSVTINDSVITNSSARGSSDKSMFLFANNEKGTPSYFASMKLYSCKIYDNDILIRDYIPCIKTSGDVGLFDSVGKKFYGNAGTGVFTGFEID